MSSKTSEFNGLFADTLPKMYQNVQAVRQPHGQFIYNGSVVADTLLCPHCGGHFIPYKGVPWPRCDKHMALVCGAPSCLRDCTDAYPEDLQRREV